MESFVQKILEVTQLVYRHERMLVPMEKLEGMKKAMFDTAMSAISATNHSKVLPRGRWQIMTTQLGSSSVLHVAPAT